MAYTRWKWLLLAAALCQPAQARDALSFAGKLGGRYPIQLLVWFDANAAPTQAYGAYWYDNKNQPVLLSGTVQAKDGGEWLDLRDDSGDLARQEVFAGVLGAKTYNGEWSVGDSDRTGRYPERRKRLNFALAASNNSVSDLSARISCGAVRSTTVTLESLSLEIEAGKVNALRMAASAKTAGGLQRCEPRLSPLRSSVAGGLLQVEAANAAPACRYALQRSGDYLLLRPDGIDGCGCGPNFGPPQVLVHLARRSCHIHYPDGN